VFLKDGEREVVVSVADSWRHNPMSHAVYQLSGTIRHGGQVVASFKKKR
jgi:hypothetical protein